MVSSQESSLAEELAVPRVPTAAETAIVRRRPVAGSRDLLRVLGCFAATRLALFIIAAATVRLVASGLQSPAERYLDRSLSLATWVRWDSWWYVDVVERGYWFDPVVQSNVAFFPLFPLVVRAVSAVVGNPVIAGLVVANVAALGGVVVFWRWMREAAGAEAAQRAVPWLLVFPFSFFFHSVYGEALFFLLVSAALLAALRRRWVVAGLLGGLAAATRPMGVLLLPALAWGIVADWRQGRRPGLSALGGPALVLAGLGSYCGYLAARFGDPLLFWRAHAAGWDVRFHWDLAGYWRQAGMALTRGLRVQGYMQLLDSLRIVLPVAFVFLTIVAFRRLGGVAGTYAALATSVAVLFAPESVGRELLAVVPAFGAAGVLDRGGPGLEALRLLSFALLAVLLVAFHSGHFVG